MTESAKKDELVGYQFNAICELGSGKQVTIIGTLPKGIDAAGMNKEFDKIRQVLDRQQAKSCVNTMEQEIDQLKARLKDAQEDLGRIDKKYDGKGGPSTQERQQRDVAVATISRMVADIVYKESALAKMREEAK